MESAPPAVKREFSAQPATPKAEAAPAPAVKVEASAMKAEAGPTLPLPLKPHGASDGFNGEAPGYMHNTRLGPGRHSGETDPDRHLHRTTHHGAMKCSRCFHYFKAANGCCANCGKLKPAGVAAGAW